MANRVCFGCRDICLVAICAMMLSIGWTGIISNTQNPPEHPSSLPPQIAQRSTNAPSIISYNLTWTATNSPYYLNSPLTVQQGVRLSIEPGVVVLANTTNSSLIIHGELHAIGTNAAIIEIGLNPNASSSVSCWSGITSQRPTAGDSALWLRNTTISGPSCGYLLQTRYFGRTQTTLNVLDNVTLRDANQVQFESDYGLARWDVRNLVLERIGTRYSYSTSSYSARFQFSSFYNQMDGGFAGNVTLIDSHAYIQYGAYISTGNTPSYGHHYRGSADGWTYRNSSVTFYDSSWWGSPSATHPLQISGNFIDSQLFLQASSSMSYDLHLSHSNFSATVAPPSWSTGYFVNVESGSYGKWLVDNNSFEPSNSWQALQYLYQSARLEANYNWWGSNSSQQIDQNITDILDNNGGSWVNYCPFWADGAMTNLSNACRRTSLNFTYPQNGSTIPGTNATFHYTHQMVSVGEWQLDGTRIADFNASNTSITLRNLSLGSHTLCAELWGIGNQHRFDCISWTSTPSNPQIWIISPNDGHVVQPLVTNVTLSYMLANVTRGWVTVNGWNQDNLTTTPMTVFGVEARGLNYGNNFVCARIEGSHSQTQDTCIWIWREYPYVEVNFTAPMDNADVFGQMVNLSYSLSNVTGGEWYLNGNRVAPLDNLSTFQQITGLEWGLNSICIEPVGINGTAPQVCIGINAITPPLEVWFITPENQTRVSGSMVTVEYHLSNVTAAQFSLNGSDIGEVILLENNSEISGLVPGPNTICLDAVGQNGQQASDCRVVLGFWIDDDGDGVPNYEDECAETIFGTAVDLTGCPDANNDADSDGVNDALDICPNTTANVAVDDGGCAVSQRDSDLDGVMDDTDVCPDSTASLGIDENGCDPSQIDSDNDGHSNLVDAFPEDGSQWSDLDGDGFGDNPNGTTPDIWPNNGDIWSDSDGDEWADQPNSSLSDDCPDKFGLSSSIIRGCPDFDGDGIADHIDQDRDGDGVPNANDLCDGTLADIDVDRDGCALISNGNSANESNGLTGSSNNGGADNGTDSSRKDGEDGNDAAGFILNESAESSFSMNTMVVAATAFAVIVILALVVLMFMRSSKEELEEEKENTSPFSTHSESYEAEQQMIQQAKPAAETYPESAYPAQGYATDAHQTQSIYANETMLSTQEVDGTDGGYHNAQAALAQVVSPTVATSGTLANNAVFDTVSNTKSRGGSNLPPDPQWQGKWGEDGYEWIEHPQSSDSWWYRDPELGTWKQWD